VPFHPKWTRLAESADRSSFMPLTKVWLSQSLFL